MILMNKERKKGEKVVEQIKSNLQIEFHKNSVKRYNVKDKAHFVIK